MWFINGAHRNGATSVAAHVDGSVQYLVTGGGDGAVRVWRFSNRELVAQFTEHSKPVSKVLIDVHSPNIIHSVSLDSSVLSYDIKASRRIICHMVTSGSMLAMTQRRDSELELITGDSLGRLLHWDIDMREPVMAMQDPSKAAIQACAVSPSGRFLAFTGDDQLLKVVDVRSGSVVALGQGHSGSVRALAWTPDERQILTGGQDMCLCVWNFFLGGTSSASEAAESKYDGGGGGSYSGRK
jgi:WD40 repeat protein